jgi:chemotaxis protein CheX
MQESDLQKFIDLTIAYFATIGSEPALVAPPHLKADRSPISDYTGVIGISGSHKGAIYFTASEALLRQCLRAMGETEPTQSLCADLVGEIANTLSANSRKYFGSEFMISVPVVLRGRPDEIRLPSALRTFIIPMSWCTAKAYLIICLE